MTVDEFRWDSWEAAPRVPHLDQECPSCCRPGPGLIRFGYTRQPEQRLRKLVRRSDAAQGIRPQARTTWLGPYWALTHVAFLCPECGREQVFAESGPDRDLAEIEQQVLPGGAELIVFPGDDENTGSI